MRRGLASRRRTLAFMVVAALVVLGVGFLAGRVVRSPAQEAADAKGPGPTVLTAPVQLQTLTAQVVTRGDVSAGTQSGIAPPPASGTSGSSTQIVTRVAATPGREIKQGQLLAEVSGRPVFALAGSVPAYRDLRPGYQGADVRQLQKDLAAMGFDPGDFDGEYGNPTKAAVKKFYESIGYEPLPASATDDQMLQTAATAVQQAQWTVQDDQKAVDQALTAAHNKANDPAVQTAQTALSRARQQLTEAQSNQNQIVKTTGPMVPLGEYAFIPSFPARVATVAAKVGSTASSPLMTVASGQLRAIGTVNAGQAALVKKDQPVDILLEATNTAAEGVVAQVSTVTGTSSSAGDTRIVVTPRGEWPATLWGQNVRLTINGAATDGKKLVVPVSALFASTDRSTRVTLVASNGTQTDVKVTVGVATGGYAAISPVGGTLAAGDKVLISADNVTTGGGS